MNKTIYIYQYDEKENEMEWEVKLKIEIGTGEDPTGWNYKTDTIIYRRYPIIDGYDIESIDNQKGVVLNNYNDMPEDVLIQIEKYIDNHEREILDELSEDS